MQHVKVRQQMVGDETCAQRVQMPVAPGALLRDVKALWQPQRQRVLGPRHAHIQQPAFFFDLGVAAGGQVGRHAAVHHVQQVHCIPFLAFGRVEGGQDEVVLIAVRGARLIAAGLRRVQRQFGDETFAAGMAGRHVRQLLQVGPAHAGVVVQTL